MGEPTLADVERRLERATDMEPETAASVLRTAREDLDALGNDPDVDEAHRQALADRLHQRLREVTERPSYSGELGASMNPEGEDAP